MFSSLQQVKRDWNRYAESDPLWAVLTDPAMKGGYWDEDAFFETGRLEMEGVMRYLATLGIEVRRHTALDFGCGVGRLTRPLATNFDQVYGVDIATVMIDRAKSYNRHIPNCKFVHVADPDFASVSASDFDFIYSNITLQHIPPRYSKRYISRLLHLLRPGGLLVFQLPAESHTLLAGRLWGNFYNRLWRRHLLRAEPVMEMYGLPKRSVIALLERNGGRILDVQPDVSAGPEWISYRYAATRL
jgi:SAM-dependent methyltransferase